VRNNTNASIINELPEFVAEGVILDAAPSALAFGIWAACIVNVVRTVGKAKISF
jgi:hypothetical protein